MNSEQIRQLLEQSATVEEELEKAGFPTGTAEAILASLREALAELKQRRKKDAMENYYEVNVSLKGFHFFATDPRSLKTREEVERCLAVFFDKFPESEGYSISVTQWESTGRQLEFPILKAKTLARRK